jgi:ubiquinol-cytochrome c reductase cytochrome c subunit
MRPPLVAMLAALLAVGSFVFLVASEGAVAAARISLSTDVRPDRVERGRMLFVEGCSSCHGIDAGGVEGVAPDLRGAGAQSADFYLRTGRMPLDKPGDQPLRSHPAYGEDDLDALVAYIGSLGGPPIPDVDTERGDLADGMRLFALNCAGCHQIGARGGVVTDAVAPALTSATATQVAEAVRIGPYVMPAFDERRLSDEQLDSIVRYVLFTQQPDNRGGWGIGNIGPVPEGMVAWLLGGAALVLCAWLIGERREE